MLEVPAERFQTSITRVLMETTMTTTVFEVPSLRVLSSIEASGAGRAGIRLLAAAVAEETGERTSTVLGQMRLIARQLRLARKSPVWGQIERAAAAEAAALRPWYVMPGTWQREVRIRALEATVARAIAHHLSMMF